MIKAVIFDMDGVIVDSEPFHWEVNKSLFSALGINVSEEYYRRFIGVSNTTMWTELKQTFGLALPVNELTDMQERGNIVFMRTNPVLPVPGVLDFINKLRKAQLPLALASSSPYSMIDIVLSSLRLTESFKVIVSGEDFKNGKPAPDIFLKTAMLLELTPQECLVIEDSMHGVHAAKAANMKCIGFANKNSGGQDLRQADVVISDFSTFDYLTAI
jgi:beta-phosphoglucomutase family hydrolase